MIRKNIFNLLYRINVFTLVICLFMFFINRTILNFFNLDYRIWLQRFYIIAMIILSFTFIILSIVYLIIKVIKNKKNIIAIVSISAIIVIISATFYLSPIIGFIALFQFVPNEEIIIKEDKRLVLETFAWGEEHYNFYEYKNVFLKSKLPIFSKIGIK